MLSVGETKGSSASSFLPDCTNVSPPRQLFEEKAAPECEKELIAPVARGPVGMGRLADAESTTMGDPAELSGGVTLIAFMPLTIALSERLTSQHFRCEQRWELLASTGRERKQEENGMLLKDIGRRVALCQLREASQTRLWEQEK